MSTTTSPRRDEDRRKSRKGIIGLAAMATAGALVIGLGFAYFSDSIDFGGSATAGTLKIDGDLTAVYNDGDGTSSSANINPGDVITVGGTLTNQGSKSAWMRESITVSGDLAPEIYVFEGDLSTTQAKALVDAGSLTVGTNGYLGAGAGTYVTTPVIVDGTAEDDVKADGTAGSDGVQQTTFSDPITMYFDAEAGNDAQGDELSWTGTADAIQYRNNTTLADVDWTAVSQVDSDS